MSKHFNGPADVPDDPSGAFNQRDLTAPILSGDSVWVTWGPVGFRFEIGYDATLTGLGRTSGAFQMSPALMKLTAQLLIDQVNQFEARFGEIPMKPLEG